LRAGEEASQNTPNNPQVSNSRVEKREKNALTINTPSLLVRLVGIQIFVKTFWIQILSRNISSDKLESFVKSFWLVGYFPAHKNCFL